MVPSRASTMDALGVRFQPDLDGLARAIFDGVRQQVLRHLLQPHPVRAACQHLRELQAEARLGPLRLGLQPRGHLADHFKGEEQHLIYLAREIPTGLPGEVPLHLRELAGGIGDEDVYLLVEVRLPGPVDGARA